MRLKISYVAIAVLAVLTMTTPAPDANAQVLKRGIQGGVAGAIIGGIVDGGSGIGKGAVIGAGIGAVAGAIEADRNQSRGAPAYAAYPPPSPAYDPALVRDTQRALYRLGYNPGPIDGQYGRRTADAIASYQSEYGLSVTGEPSPRLLDDMISHGG